MDHHRVRSAQLVATGAKLPGKCCSLEILDWSLCLLRQGGLLPSCPTTVRMVQAHVPTYVIALLATGFGLIVGSFLNVVVYRVPRGESVVAPRSHCTACGAGILPRDNVPVVSWLVLRGHCRACGTKISVRYVVVELFTAAIFASLAVRLGVVVSLPVSLVLAAALVTVAAISTDGLSVPASVAAVPLAVAAAIAIPAEVAYHEWEHPGSAALGAAIAWIAVGVIEKVIAWAPRIRDSSSRQHNGLSKEEGPSKGVSSTREKLPAVRAGRGAGEQSTALIAGAMLGWFGFGVLVLGAGFILAGVLAGACLDGRRRFAENTERADQRYAPHTAFPAPMHEQSLTSRLRVPLTTAVVISIAAGTVLAVLLGGTVIPLV